MQADDRQRGLALLVVLWIIVSAALVVSAFNASVKSGVSFVGSEVQLARTEALLDAGAEIAVTRLIDEDEARHWLPDGRPHVVSFAGARIAIAIADGNGRIDLNKADKALLMGLLRRFAGSEAKAGRLCDRILLARGTAAGAKEQPQTQQGLNGDGDQAEQPVSEALAFVDVAQLRGLEGMTAELYRAIAPFLTVYSGDGRINPLAAPDEVLAVIPGLDPRDIENLRVAARAPQENDAVLSDIAQRAGAYLADHAGPAFVVTVEVLRRDGTPGASGVYVLVPGLDKDAPYRLIGKRPVASGRLSGASEVKMGTKQ